MPGQYFLIAAGSRTSWAHNWSDFLATDDQGNALEVIDSRQWSVTPVHTDVSPEMPRSLAKPLTVVFIENPRSGVIYELSETIHTSLGRD